MMISGSVLAVKNGFLDYANILKQSGVDYLHIDLFDADNGEFKLRDILSFDNSYLPLDIHLIYSSINPTIIDTLNKSTAHFLSVQYETLTDPIEALKIIKQFKGRAGLAITSQTSFAEIESYISELHHILIMCSEPGVSGAKFSSDSYNLIDHIHDKYPTLDIFADGGIESGIAKAMSRHNVKLIVSGSFLAQNISQIDSAIFNLKYNGENNIPLNRELIKPFLLPMVSQTTGFFDIISAMTKMRMGLSFVLENEKLIGLISDGDIRRAYLRYGRDIFDKVAGDIVNKNYFWTNTQITIDELYMRVLRYDKAITIVPVISDGIFLGAISLR